MLFGCGRWGGRGLVGRGRGGLRILLGKRGQGNGPGSQETKEKPG
jgi:hypothetical protein